MNLQEIKKFYRDEIVFVGDIHPSHHQITKFISKLKPESILEFGACWGKNYTLLEQLIPRVYYRGIDISRKHINLAKCEGINVTLGDETTLPRIESKSYDLVFTHSVLNHLPLDTVTEIVKEFKRIAKHHVIIGECNEIEEDRWFKHDYLKLGFDDTNLKSWSKIICAYYKVYKLATQQIK